MTLTIRRSHERGHADHGWLDTWHTFSFADYVDPRWMGYRHIRVLNEDTVAPLQGFGMHGHREMEIVTIVRSGELAHRDSLGHREVIRAGEVQRMTAGTGIRHSEVNPSSTEAVHLFQIWLLPERAGLEPGYEQKPFDPAGRRNAWQLIVSPDGTEGSLRWNQDARLYLLDLEAGRALSMERPADRHGWVQVIAGAGTLNGQALAAGDAAALVPGDPLALESGAAGMEVMVFDLA